jgi:hypothetical protein
MERDQDGGGVSLPVVKVKGNWGGGDFPPRVEIERHGTLLLASKPTKIEGFVIMHQR